MGCFDREAERSTDKKKTVRKRYGKSVNVKPSAPLQTNAADIISGVVFCIHPAALLTMVKEHSVSLLLYFLLHHTALAVP